MRWLIGLTLITALFAGCIGGDADELEPQNATQQAPELDLPVLEDGIVKMDVRVPVVLIGYPDEAAAALEERLDSETVAHGTGDFNQVLPPDPEEGVEGNAPLMGTSMDVPIHPTARYDVQPVDDTFEANLTDRLPEWRLPRENVALYDGSALEAYLADTLPEAGFELDPNAPTIVLLHLDALDIDLHTWRYDFPHGYLTPTRIFGEQTPMLIMDPSATMIDNESLSEQVVNNATGEEHDHYGDRLSTSGQDLEEIAGMVREATHYRILQGSVYPTPLADCHAITLITAYRPTSIGEAGVAGPTAEELFHPNEIQAAFENLTGSTVHVDAKLIELPVDDPVLDALSRGEFGTLEAQRFWISQNWEDYWVPHEGCEPYVSFVLEGDAASASSGIIGIGTYDASKSYRIAISWVNDVVRYGVVDPASPAVEDDPSMGHWNWVDYLHAHETGHIIGQRHPHDVSRDDGSGTSQAYDDVWSVMSYDTDGRVIDFGVIDQANWQRNRAAFVVHAAQEAGLTDEPAFQQAKELMAQYKWDQAADLLWPLVDQALQGDHGQGGPPAPGLLVGPAPSHEHADR